MVHIGVRVVGQGTPSRPQVRASVIVGRVGLQRTSVDPMSGPGSVGESPGINRHHDRGLFYGHWSQKPVVIKILRRNTLRYMFLGQIFAKSVKNDSHYD